MPPSKLKKEFQYDEEDGTAVVPIEAVAVRPSTLKERAKRPQTDRQKENLAKMIEANKARWAQAREAKQKALEEEKERMREELRKEVEAKLQAGTHVRVKVEKSGTGPKPKPKVPKPHRAKPVPEPEPVETEEDTTELDTTEVEESEDELPPRRVVRQARKQMRTLAKIDEVIQQSANPYMSKLMGRWQ